MRRNVVINWGVSSYYGWGVYGLNLALAWAHDPELQIMTALPVNARELAVDPVRMRALTPFLRESARLHEQLKAFPNGGEVGAQTPMLAGLASDFTIQTTPEGVRISGKPSLGITFFETANHSPEAIARAAQLPLIITGSSWNEEVLRAHGLTNVRTILQGVDPTLFHPAPRSRFAGDRFLVFSGGKLEPRKGQDLAMAAFRKFAERRPEAILVAAWHSPWPEFAKRLDKTGIAAPVVFDDKGRLDAAGWAAANGLRPDQFLDAGQTPNPLMPQLLRQMDAGLFTNRCEGGTNLVAMECMACGVPTILSANTGHLDLIADDNCYPLRQQGVWTMDAGAKPFGAVKGWGESDVDEAVEALERAYRDRDDAARRGERAAATLSQLTWTRTAARVKEALLEVCAAAGV